MSKQEIPKSYHLLPQKFYLNDSLTVAPALIGCVICTYKNTQFVSVRIAETEAYPSYDVASHAFDDKLTSRTEVQFSNGGSLYVYLIMGLYLMTSIVVGRIGTADVVFIRSVEPLEGIEVMKDRRGYSGEDLNRIASGPGMLSIALGINKNDNGLVIYDPISSVRIYKDDKYNGQLCSGSRINLGISGVSKSEEKRSRQQPWRYYIKNSKFLSK